MPLDGRLYEALRGIAERSFARERNGHTLQPTALVNEAWLRLARGRDPAGSPERPVLLAACARVVREVLVDHARRRTAAKRDAGCRVTLHEGAVVGEAPTVDLLALDEALSRLAERHPRPARVVELRSFAGLTVDESAASLGVSPRTVDGDWQFARAWLIRELGESSG